MWHRYEIEPISKVGTYLVITNRENFGSEYAVLYVRKNGNNSLIYIMNGNFVFGIEQEIRYYKGLGPIQTEIFPRG